MIDDLEESPFATGSSDFVHRLLRALAGRVACDCCNVDDRHRVAEFLRIGDRASIKIRLTLGVQ